MMPLNGLLSKKMATYVARTMKARDRRVKFTNEILQGVRIIKLFAWEKPLLAQLHEKREEELKAVFDNMMLSAVFGFVFTAAPLVVTCATFATYAALGNTLTAATAFASLSLFQIIRFPLTVFPMMLARTIDLAVTNKRLSKFFNVANPAIVDLDSSEPDGPSRPPLTYDGHYLSSLPAARGAPCIEIGNATFQWPEPKKDEDKDKDKDKKKGGRRGSIAGPAPAAAPVPEEPRGPLPPTLSNISLEVAQGSFVGVAGPVGAGKSSLLSSILADIPRTSGRVCVRGSVAYCSQEPWIQNMSLRDNILFGRRYDARLYERVIGVCALKADLDALEGGDSVEIGERGINLSGGQKARIALARACYAQSSIVLLDDVLSAVDAEVGARLVNECILDFLRKQGTTVVLVTHHTQWLVNCSHVVEIAVDGTIARQGLPTDVLPRHASETSLAATAAAAEEAEATTPGVPRQRSGTTPKAAEKAPEDKKKAQLMVEEDRERGVVARSVWTKYAVALGPTALLCVLSMHVTAQVFTFGSSWWLAIWSRDQYPSISGGKPWFYIAIYAALSAFAAVFILCRTIVVAFASLRAGRRIHDLAMQTVVGAPMSFFDTTPLGRILNRFSGDVRKVDVDLSMSGSQFVGLLATLIGTLALMVFSSTWILIAVPVLGYFYLKVASYYRNSAREIQRLDSISKSPIYAAFSEALNGAVTIQAYKSISRFEEQSRRRFDHNQRAGFVNYAANRWLSVRLELLSNALLMLTALLSVVIYIASGSGSDAVAAGMAGLALSYAPGLTDTLSFLIRQFTTLETDMVSAERLFAYSELDAEELPASALQPVAPTWPSAGALTFRSVTMSYRAGLKPVLADLNLEVRPGEKVGLVGRTGAGKSSILVCLYRLVELSSGTIEVDGVNIGKISLSVLRSRLAIIPQDPVLFTGSLRYNLDPFDEHSDETLNSVLNECGILKVVSEHPEGLSRQLDERGSNLSMGQRQLVCMGRALLKRARVLVLDEATASVDLETDELIQATLRNSLGGVTVLTIAHRLDTIMHCDTVVVLGAGHVLEAGPPLELRNKPGGAFADLWEAHS